MKGWFKALIVTAIAAIVAVVGVSALLTRVFDVSTNPKPSREEQAISNSLKMVQSCTARADAVAAISAHHLALKLFEIAGDDLPPAVVVEGRVSGDVYPFNCDVGSLWKTMEKTMKSYFPTSFMSMEVERQQDGNLRVGVQVNLSALRPDE